MRVKTHLLLLQEQSWWERPTWISLLLDWWEPGLPLASLQTVLTPGVGVSRAAHSPVENLIFFASENSLHFVGISASRHKECPHTPAVNRKNMPGTLHVFIS